MSVYYNVVYPELSHNEWSCLVSGLGYMCDSHIIEGPNNKTLDTGFGTVMVRASSLHRALVCERRVVV